MPEPVFYYAVIGRVPFDDEDSCLFFTGPKDLDVRYLFEAEMYGEGEAAQERMEQNRKAHGSAVFINHILVSASPIETE